MDEKYGTLISYDLKNQSSYKNVFKISGAKFPQLKLQVNRDEKSIGLEIRICNRGAGDIGNIIEEKLEMY